MNSQLLQMVFQLEKSVWGDNEFLHKGVSGGNIVDQALRIYYCNDSDDLQKTKDEPLRF